MNSLRSSFPRFATALFAATIIAWCLVQTIPFEAPPTASPHPRNALLAGGVMAAPLAVPFLTLWVASARE